MYCEVVQDGLVEEEEVEIKGVERSRASMRDMEMILMFLGK